MSGTDVVYAATGDAAPPTERVPARVARCPGQAPYPRPASTAYRQHARRPYARPALHTAWHAHRPYAMAVPHIAEHARRPYARPVPDVAEHRVGHTTPDTDRASGGTRAFKLSWGC
eukprot:3408047-Rhodomonas_salina.1